MPKPIETFDLADSFEKIPVKIFEDLYEGSLFAAKTIASLIREKQAKEEKLVLGLATGSTPRTLYAELVRMNKVAGLSFNIVITLNFDEYYLIYNDAMHNYIYYINSHLFNHI